MKIDQHRANAAHWGILMVGLGVLAATNYVWAGILFVFAVASLVQCVLEGYGWYRLQWMLWVYGIIILVVMGFKLPVFLVFLGVSILIGVFIKPPFLARKPHADTTFE